MRCAVVTCSEYKKRMFKKDYATKRLTFDNVKDEILIVNIAYRTDKFYTLGEKKKKRLCKSICAELKKSDVRIVFLSGIVQCGEFSDIEKQFYIPDGKRVMRAYVGKALYMASDKYGAAGGKKSAAVYVKSFSHDGLEIIKSAAHFFEDITIVGCGKADAEKYSEKIMDMTGLCLSCALSLAELNGCDFLVLCDSVDKEDENQILKFTAAVDLQKENPLALKRARFYAPERFNRLLPYFCVFDDVFAEFLVCACSENLQADVLQTATGAELKFKSLF